MGISEEFCFGDEWTDWRDYLPTLPAVTATFMAYANHPTILSATPVPSLCVCGSGLKPR